jgi:molybdenum cofactor biosynthesis enzyme MoaA
MSKIIEEYYAQAKTMPVIVRQKLNKLQRHTDILQEFDHWIQNGTYTAIDCVSVGGYTAQKLAELSEYMNGEGAFMLLIELRENPEKAKRRIADGFRMK